MRASANRIRSAGVEVEDIRRQKLSARGECQLLLADAGDHRDDPQRPA